MLAGATFATAGLAQPGADPVFSGEISVGIRSVDVSGAETKYREDLNLDDGARLFDVRLAYAPAATAEDAVVDRLELRASNLGGDPFESLHLGVQKYGAYRIDLDRRKSDYFYDDVILPSALASVTASTSGDHHRFDFERVRDTADVAIDLTRRTRLNLGLEHTTRTGYSTTTLDVARDEFELERPFDESTEVLTLGVEHAWDRVTLIVDDETRRFENATDVFLPGASPGENTADTSELLFFSFDQSYDFTSRGHAVRVLARPTDRTDLKASWRREDLDLDLAAAEESSGIDFAGMPFATDAAGGTTIARDIDLAELDFGFELGDRIVLTAALLSRSLAQDGSMLLGPGSGEGRWDIGSDGLELGAAVAVGANTVISAGTSREERDTRYFRALGTDTLGAAERTDRSGAYARIEYRGDGGLTLTAAVEDDSIDDPFTLGSPTSSRRVRLSARHAWDNGLSVDASHRASSLENDNSAWSADTEQTSLRLAYARPRIELAAGYALIELERDIDQLVTGGTRQDLFGIHYAASARLVDFSLRWRLNDRVAVGGMLGAYSNGGSYPLDRDDFRAFIELALGAPYSLRVAYRSIDYDEDRFDDYDADLVEVALGLRF